MMIRFSVWILGALLLWMPSLAAAEKPADGGKKEEQAKPTEGEARFNALKAGFDKAKKDFLERVRSASPEERQKLFDKQVRAEDHAQGFLALATELPDDPAAFQALSWIVMGCRSGKALEEALKILRKKHLRDPEMATLVPSLGRSPSPKADKLLRALTRKGANREVKGKASFYLASLLNNRLRLARIISELEPERLETFKKYYSKEYLERLRKLKPQKILKEMEALYTQVVAKYKDIKDRRRTLGEAAGAELFEIRNLAIGKVAPEIQGEDLDGKMLKLSDYRGKVVVLDFWGNW